MCGLQWPVAVFFVDGAPEVLSLKSVLTLTPAPGPPPPGEPLDGRAAARVHGALRSRP